MCYFIRQDLFHAENMIEVMGHTDVTVSITADVFPSTHPYVQTFLKYPDVGCLDDSQALIRPWTSDPSPGRSGRVTVID